MKDESALVDRTYDNQNDFFHLNDNYLEEYKRDFALPLAFTAAPVLAEMPSGVLNDILRSQLIYFPNTRSLISASIRFSAASASARLAGT